MEVEITKLTNNCVSDESPSSITAEAASSDSQEQLIDNENLDINRKGKERRINRRIALALARAQESSPCQSPTLGKVMHAHNNTIDLTVEDDDPTQKWFKRTFADRLPLKKIKNEDTKDSFAIPRDVPKNVPKSLKMNSILKKKLEASMRVKRREGQERRKQMYEMDNQHLRPDVDDDEEEEIIKKRKKRKIIRKKPLTDGDEYDSEDDEDYKEEITSGDSSDNDADDESKNINVTVDLFEARNMGRIREDDELSFNILDDSFTYDVFNNVKHQSGPGSTISFFEPKQDDILNKIIHLPTVQAMEEDISKNCSNDEDFGDILSLCSGKFGSTQIISTMDKKMVSEKESSFDKKENGVENIEKEKEDETDGVELNRNNSRKKHILGSDDEEEIENDNPETIEPLPETVPLTENTETELSENIPRRVVINDDDDDEDEKEDIHTTEDTENNNQEDEEEEDEEKEEREDDQEEEEEEEEDERIPNFDDEDDELAVIKRIEYKEYKKKVKKKNFFDDEASLSGDDVGSDIDEEDAENDAYEAEEGDADDVPDTDTIRRQNHRLLLKQESDREARALAKLQDKLLADGDLGGVETNRQFRFRIREELQIEINDEENDGNNEDEDDENEDDDEKRAERARMLKFRIEKAAELMLLDEPRPVNDPFEKASRIVKSTKENEFEVQKGIIKPSLLSKSSLASTIQEAFTTAGAAPKQMYVQNYNPSSSAPLSSSNLNRASMKRGRESPDISSAKRVRKSKLSVLES